MLASSLALFGCSASSDVDDEPFEPLSAWGAEALDSTTQELEGDETAGAEDDGGEPGAQASWKLLAFRGAHCDERFEAVASSSGPDAAFVPGLGVNVQARKRARRVCHMRGTLLVPPGYYPSDLSYTLGYGGLKPEDGKFRLDSAFALRVRDGAGAVEVVPEEGLAFEDAFAVETLTRELSPHQKRFCRSDRRLAMPVTFANGVRIVARAGRAPVVVDVDSVDVSVQIAQCPLFCKRGYEPVDGVCKDIDECATGQARCPKQSVCVNKPGGYGCILRR